jgi:alpha-tubulin suppressor-like RCC1 family protein
MRTKCPTGATCADMPDGLACTCLSGYSGDGITCSDLDECAITPSRCSPDAACRNTPGSFACTCLAGFVGDGSYCVPQRFTKIAAGSGFSCGLSDAGEVYCWGDASGALDFSVPVPHAHPLRIGTASDWIDIGVQGDTACGIRSDHSIWCWVIPMAAGAEATKVVSDKPGTGWRALAVGDGHACGLHDDGGLACWGFVPAGYPLDPVAVDTNTDWTDIATGSVTCGIRGAPGQLYCWGQSFDGALGLGDVFGVGPSVCARKLDDTLWCWSTPPGIPDLPPVQVGTDRDWKTVAVGGETCAIKTGGTLWCWAEHAVLGDGSPLFDIPVVRKDPVQIGSDTDWSAVVTTASGGNKSCALKRDGTLWCWGIQAAPLPDIVTTPVPIR